MSVAVKTHVRCDRCGATDAREGTHEEIGLPMNWARLHLHRMSEDFTMRNSTSLVLDLCPKCRIAVTDAARTEQGKP